MPIYRGLNNNSPADSRPAEPTRRLEHFKPIARFRTKPAQNAKPLASEVTSPLIVAADLDPVVGWLVIISEPGRGQALPLRYGVNDIGYSDKSRVRLNFGDEAIALDNQAAIIYTGGSRRFYLQSMVAEVWVGGQPTQSSIQLNGGEVLQLGQTQLKFVPLCGLDFDWRDNH
jgi:hypothetical protein